MYMQDDKLSERLAEMGIGKDQRDLVDSWMTQEDINFSNVMMSMFQDNAEYNKTNEVYRQVFGVSLRRVDKYVPLRSQALTDLSATDKDSLFSQFAHDKTSRATVTNISALKKRNSSKKNKLHIQGDISLFNSYYEEIAHFRTHALRARLALSFFRNEKTRKDITEEYGQDLYNHIMRSLTNVIADGKESGQQYSSVDSFVNAYITTSIAASNGVFLKQLISISNYAQHVPPHLLVTGLAKFMLTNPVKNVKLLWNSDYLKNRRTSTDRDVQELTNLKEYKRFQFSPSWNNFITLNVRIGDSLAIAIGGWVQQDYLKTQINPETGVMYTQEEALYVTFRASERTQQSSSLQEMSKLQTGGSVNRALTAYSTGPVQAIRQELEATRDYKDGKITFEKWARVMFIYHVWVPALYSLVSSGISGDDAEDTLRTLGIAIGLGPIGSTYAVGRAISNTARHLVGLKPYQDTGSFKRTVDYVERTAKKVITDPDELTLEDGAQAMQALFTLSGRAVPVVKAERTVENLVKGDIKGAVFATKPEKRK